MMLQSYEKKLRIPNKQARNLVVIQKVCIFADVLQTMVTMSTKTMTQVIADYFKTQPVLKAWLFGSFARGEEREDSDVDILVKFDRSLPIGLFAYVRMHF